MSWANGLSELQAEICDLALKGVRPYQIYERMGGRVTRGTIGRAIRNGRAMGLDIPPFSKNAVSRTPVYQQYRAPINESRSKKPPAELTPEDKTRIADLASRGLGITAIAPLIGGKPYRLVIAEIERLKLSRAGG